MKSAALWVLAAGILCASQTLTIDQQQALRTYNHKLSQAYTVQKRMNTFAKFTQDQAKKIAKQQCLQEALTATLIHHRTYLFYHIKGQDCNLRINALDGAIITNKEMQ